MTSPFVLSTLAGMINLFPAFAITLISVLKDHRDLALENLALRQQLAVFKRLHRRPQLRLQDHLFWVWLSKIWSGWRSVLLIVKPETVITSGIQTLLDEDFAP